MHFKLSSAICFNLDQSEILTSGNGLVIQSFWFGIYVAVCSDNHVMDMNIVDATVVIHYDLPDSKTKFGNRMSCMRQHFYNFTGAKQKKVLILSFHSTDYWLM